MLVYFTCTDVEYSPGPNLQFWKAETAGDCWCAVIGEPRRPSPHADLAVRVAGAVLTAVRRVSTSQGVRSQLLQHPAETLVSQ